MTDFFNIYLQAGQTNLSNLLLNNYRKLGFTEQEFVFYLQLESYLQKGQSCPDLEKIAQQMQLSLADLYPILEQLLAKKLLQIESITDTNGKKNDRYNFDLVYKKLQSIIDFDLRKQETSKTLIDQQSIFASFEKEFGRPLSSFEIEMFNTWFTKDHYRPEIVLQALKEAVLNRKLNFKYIDRILINWENQGLTTLSEIQQSQNQFKIKQNSVDTTSGPKIPLTKWQ